MKIIQIRGNNGVGKTTMVREFIKKHDSEIVSINVNKREIECHKINDIIIIGRYDKNACGGCDSAIKTADELKEVIAKIIRQLKPGVLIFEGVMYGKTVKFTEEIYSFARKAHYDFLAVCLEPSFETSLARIYERNGGKEINVKSLAEKWKHSITSNQKLREMKIPTITYDTGKMSVEEMGEVLENVL